MAQNRVFLPQEALDGWLAEDRATIEGDFMTLKPDGERFRLRTALRFMSDLAGGGDAHKLVGKVKDVEQLLALGGEHMRDSVVLGDDAYQVVEGFVCEPVPADRSAAVGGSLDAATRAAVGEGGGGDDVDLLARFFLQQR